MPKVKWQERFHSICVDCFLQRQTCNHYQENALSLLIVGHNPSQHSGKSGYSFSNPSNRFWKLLNGTFGNGWDGVLPKDTGCKAQNTLPSTMGIGFTDVCLEVGSDANAISRKKMLVWKDHFYDRLKSHMDKALKPPEIIAFVGKRQYQQLFANAAQKMPYGRQSVLPKDFPCRTSQVWVLPSPSGRAVLSNEERQRPYKQLALAYKNIGLCTSGS